MISALSLTRRFGSRVAIDDVTFSVQRSEIVALLGPNGAGKTTTLRLLAGLIAPSAGSMLIDDVPMTGATAATLRGRIGFLTETPGLWDRLTVRENLRVYAGLYSVEPRDRVVSRAIETFELADRADTRTAELSKGLRQKVALARALLHDPVVLLLDEPTSGLDPEVTRAVRALLVDRRNAGCAILVSTHNLDVAERLADRVAVLDGRLLAFDRPEILRQRFATGRVLVRVASRADVLLVTARAFDPGALVEDGALSVRLSLPERDIPLLVRALVHAGADVLEVRPELPALEDAYLRLIGTAPGREAGNGPVGRAGAPDIS